jgi:pantoate--beta-alanine ligase
MNTVPAVDDLRRAVAGWKAEGLRIGFVPTLGALHEGHLALVRRARELADRVVASVFVNPAQFGPQEDLGRYPRQPERDAELLAAAGCHLLFLPDAAAIYPPGGTTWVVPEGPAEGLEGAARPGHFRGVATVVLKLFHLVTPDVAVFGEKDAQQLAVIERLARDLFLPVEIVPHPTVREPDGLAMSSRNAYLSPAERRAATILYRALEAAREVLSRGERDGDEIRLILREMLETEPLVSAVDYAEVVDAETFQPVRRLAGRIVLPLAVRIGGTRLIDNLRVDLD